MIEDQVLNEGVLTAGVLFVVLILTGLLGFCLGAGIKPPSKPKRIKKPPAVKK